MKIGRIQVCYISPKRSVVTDKNADSKRRLSRSRIINTLQISIMVLTAFILNIQKLYAKESSQDAMKKLDVAGETVLEILQKIGYWGAIFMAVWEGIGAIKEGDTNKILSIAVKYLLAYATLKGLPWAFDLIGNIF